MDNLKEKSVYKCIDFLEKRLSAIDTEKTGKCIFS